MKAVIDLGSNTFHLLIVNAKGEFLKPEFKQRIFVRLLENVSNNSLDLGACQRAHSACRQFHKTLKQFQVETLKVIGTAAFRDTDNGLSLKDELEEILHTEIAILTDEEEAFFIFEGVAPSVLTLENPYLIMDIGGGSVEFVAVTNGKRHFSQSFKLGLHRLSAQINYQGQITESQYLTLQEICREMLSKKQEQCKALGLKTLVGNAGSFEICNAIAFKEQLNSVATIIDIPTLETYFEDVKKMGNYVEADWIPKKRKKMLPLAFVFIENILDLFEIEELIYSPWSLKEGILLNI